MVANCGAVPSKEPLGGPGPKLVNFEGGGAPRMELVGGYGREGIQINKTDFHTVACSMHELYLLMRQ